MASIQSPFGATKVHTVKVPVYLRDTLELNGRRGVVIEHGVNPYRIEGVQYPEGDARNDKYAVLVDIIGGGRDWWTLRSDHEFVQGTEIETMRYELVAGC